MRSLCVLQVKDAAEVIEEERAAVEAKTPITEEVSKLASPSLRR